MKKTFKKQLASLLATAVAVAGMSTVPAMMVGAEEGAKNYKADFSANNVIDKTFQITDPTEVTFTLAGFGETAATIGLADAGWGYQDWESSVAITGDGTYTVTSKSAADAGAEIGEGVVVFVVDIPVATEAIKIADTDYVVSDVKVNGEAVNFIYGDMEDKGNVRIEIYNEYGPTNNDETVWTDVVPEVSEAAKAYKADFSANNVIDKTFQITDPTEVTFTLAGFGETAATLGLADAGWGYQDWESSVAVAGDGTYTVTSKSAADAGAEIGEGVVVFVVDIPVATEAIKIADTDYVVSDVKVNGEAVNFIYGDIEEKGNVRIEIYNEYGPTNNDETVWTDEAPAPVEEVAVAALDKNGTYNAYIGIQTPTFSFRNAWYDSYGKDTAEFNQITGWEGSDAIVRQGTINDTKIEGNGTYTVSITDMDLAGDFDTQDYFNLIFISTDIPNSGEITISDMKLTVDGRNVEINPIVSPDSKEWLTMLIQNIWNDDVKTIGYYAVPPTNMEITFTVSGFAYDKAADATETATTEGTTTAPAETEEKSSNAGLIAGIVGGVVVLAGAGVGIGVAQKKKKK